MDGKMPVNEKVMKNLKSEYGNKKGENVYYAMENSGKIKPQKASKGALEKLSRGK